MKHTHHHKRLAVIGSFGALCSVIAFALGMQSSGSMHAFDRTQAALTGPVAAVSGDMDQDGELTIADSIALLERVAKLEVATQEDIRNGDLDGDYLLTDKDVLVLLRSLSQR